MHIARHAQERPRPDPSSATVTAAHTLYFAAVAGLALWVGIWGYVLPARVDRYSPAASIGATSRKPVTAAANR